MSPAKHEIQSTDAPGTFFCSCGANGELAEVSDHLSHVSREEADAALARVWTMVCTAEDRSYTSIELKEMIASCTDATDRLRTLSRSVESPAEMRRVNKVDQHRIDHGDYVRASGETYCKICGHMNYDHPQVVGFEWLRRACDGKLLKL